MADERWRALDAELGLHELEKKVASGWCWRSLCVPLDGGGLLVVSPIRGTARSLEELGEAAAVLAPNHFHYLGVEELTSRHEAALVGASAVAAPRLEKKMGRPLAPLDAIRERLPRAVTLLEPPGLKTGEVWLRAETARGVAWAVGDAFFNVNDPVSGGTGLVLKLTATVPGLRVGRTFRWLGIGDRPAYRAWLRRQIEDDRPRVLIPAHGDVVEGDDLAERLAAIAAGI